MKKAPEKKMQQVVDKTQQALAQRLYDLRVEREFTQTELSELAGVDRKTINRIENGHFAPSIDTLVRLSIVLRVPVTSLLA
jgi:transcriptional regulator with XRE-family HTH domain